MEGEKANRYEVYFLLEDPFTRMSDNEEAVHVVIHLHASRFSGLNSLDDWGNE